MKQTTRYGPPRVASSTTSTVANQTGSWKYIRPFYQDKIAPCNAACPVGIDIEAYIALIREGRWQGARELLLQENPLPAITGRVCDHPCEQACNRSQFDAAVSIHAVERVIGDMILQTPPARANSTSTHTIAVVGSGPAGLACAYHLVKLGHDVIVIEAAAEPGGMLRLGIPEFRLPRRILDQQIEWLEALGVCFRTNTELGTDIAWEDLSKFDAVFLATGAHSGRMIGIDEEDGPTFMSGLDFLKAVNVGQRPSIGREILVIGGGNTAIDCARTVLRLGADPLVVYRRTRNEMPAIEQEIREAESEGVRFQFLSAPVSVRHGESGTRGLNCIRMELGPVDASGRRRPVPVTGSEFTIASDTIIKAIGETSQLDYLPVALEREGTSLIVGGLGETNIHTVFAGGDMTEDTRSVAFALGAGKRGAIGIDRLLRPGRRQPDELAVEQLKFADGNVSMARWMSSDPVARAAPVNRVVSFDELNVNHFRHLARNEDRTTMMEENQGSFQEVNPGLTSEDAITEAGRCFNCGVCNGCELCLILCPDIAISRGTGEERFIIDMAHCKGCGICVEECPRGAMAMTREGL